MNRQSIKEIILDQKEMYLSQSFITREYDLEKNINYCFVGIRRTGKSYLMYQLVHELMSSGVSKEQIVYVNFEDERLLEMTADDFNTILELAIEFAGLEKQPHFFLDEIHNIHGWEKFVRRLADMKYHVNITGSNSKMLSYEIASTLGGRFMIVNVYPYAFTEFMDANHAEIKNAGMTTKSRAEINRLYDSYVKYGAFPELVNIKSKRNYLNSIYQTIYLGDIIARNNITNDFAVRLILKKVAESVMRPLSYSRLSNILKSAGAAIGKQTVINYVGFALDSFLLFQVQNYAAKLIDKETAPKYYFMDNGLLGLLLTGNIDTIQLENLAAIELIRRYGMANVFYFERNVEIDFYVPEQNLAVQVSYSIFRDNFTYKRETGALVKLNEYLPGTECIILTMDEEKEIEEDGVLMKVLPMWKWLLKI